ncbi:MAG: N-acyl homoserine lactonase family protein [Bacteroidota bacterium]|nr:N-acyl homoserine lactonase family protein [Bacteroidota bacterium]
MKLLLPILLLLQCNAMFSQAPHYEVYAVRFASSAYPFTIADWADKGPKDPVKIDFMVWLVKGDNGKNILVDAGFLNDIPNAAEFKIVNYVRPDSALLPLGLAAKDITDIIVSHPHWDHIDGLNLFPNAKIWMQQDDYGYFVGQAWQKDGEPGGFVQRDVRMLLELNLAGRLVLIKGDNQNILPGITVYTGSKHTYESQYALVETGKRKVILASDNIWVYYSLENLRPAAYGGTLDTTAYKNAMLRMKQLAPTKNAIIPGHDGKIFMLFPVISPGVVRID